MKKNILFLLLAVSFLRISAQMPDYNRIWVYDFKNEVTNKYGLIKIYGGKTDTMVSAKYDEMAYMLNSNIHFARDNKQWYMIDALGKASAIPYTEYLVDGLFLVKENGKSSVFSALKNKMILSGVDSVAFNTIRFGTQYVLDVYKNKIFYYADVDGNLIYAQGYKEEGGGYNHLVYEISKTNNKTKINTIGLALKSLDNKETELIPIQFDFIFISSDRTYAIAKKANQYFLFDGLFKQVAVSEIEPEKIIDDIFKIKQKGKFGLIDLKGTTVLPCEFDVLQKNYTILTVKKNNKFGYYSFTGKEILPCTYDLDNVGEVNDSPDNILRIFSKNEGFGAITPLLYYNNDLGKKISFSEYTDIIPFNKDGEQQLLYAKKAGKYGVIDWYNAIIVPFEYDTIGTYVVPAGFTMFKGIYPMKKNGVFGFLDDDLKTLVPPTFQNVDLAYFEIGMPVSFVPVKNNGKWGLLDLQSKKTNNCVYDTIISVKSYENNVATYILQAMKDGAIYPINTIGQRLYNTGELFFKKSEKGYFLCIPTPEEENFHVLTTEFTDMKYIDGDVFFKVGKLNGKYQLIDNTLAVIGEYDDVEPFSDDGVLFRVRNNGKFGYVNNYGKIVVQCEYELIDKYKLDFTTDGNPKAVKQNGKWGLVNLSTGKQVVPCLYSDIKVFYDYEAQDGKLLALVESKGKKGLYTTEGKVIIPCESEKIETVDYANLVYTVNGKKGAVNASLQPIFPPLYDGFIFTEDPAFNSICIVKQNEKFGLFDEKGKQIVPFQYDEIEALNRNFTAQKDKKYFLLDTTGRLVIPDEFEDLGGYYDVLYAKKNGKYGYISSEGRTLITFEYEAAKEMTDSLLIVMKNKKYGVIDFHQQTQVPFDYEDLNFCFYQDGKNCFYAKKENWGLVDSKGNELIPFNYEMPQPRLLLGNIVRRYTVYKKGKAGVFEYGKGEIIAPEYRAIEEITIDDNTTFYRVMKGEKRGLLDFSGKSICPIEFDEIAAFSDGMASVKKGGKYGYIDLTGKLVIPFQYDAADYFTNGKAQVTVKKDKKTSDTFVIDKTGKRIE